MKLLRNSNDRNIRNPEFHLDQLGRSSHFLRGSGIDLMDPKGHVTSKEILHGFGDGGTSPRKVDLYRPGFAFDVHDEGLEFPNSALYAANGKLHRMADSKTLDSTYDEIWHRSPYRVEVGGGDHYGSGAVLKSAVDHTPIRNRFNNHYMASDAGTWGNYDTGRVQLEGDTVTEHPDFKTALEDTRARFRARNLHRTAPSQDVRDLVQDVLRNPDEETLRQILRTSPHLASPQFVGVGREAVDVGDVLDLKTGNWAKMHPDGYFPT